jgi:outer membrane protein assembly factor BamB
MGRPALPACLLLLVLGATAPAGDAKEELWAAARKGDAAAVEAVLAKGVDVNVRTDYGATALHFAADKGHVAVVRVLLRHKANVNLKDSFYNFTPLTWANYHKHWAVIKELVEAGAEGGASLLTDAAKDGQADVVRAILAKYKPSESALSAALAAAPAKHQEVAEALRKAGAKPAAKAAARPKAAPAVDAESLKSYAGKYEGEQIPELTLAIKDGKLQMEMGGRSLALDPVDRTTFKVPGNDGLSVLFQREGEKVAALTIKSGSSSFKLRRVEPKSANVDTPKPPRDDETVEVKVPLNWPSFRGPNASGTADGQHPPITWDVSKGDHVCWKTPIPGLGHSCPVVWGDGVFVTTAVSGDPKSLFKPGLYGDVDSVNDSTIHSWRVYCLDKRSGRVLWERTAREGVPKVKRHMKGSHANPTPATDGKHLVVSFGSEGLYCYDLDGKPLWHRDLGTLDSGWFYDPDYQWGFGSSPVLYRDRVIVQCDVGKGSFLAAYDVESGKPLWTTPRVEIPSWGTPTVYEDKGHAELVTNATKFVRGYDPMTGKELWRLGRNAEITVPTPVFGHGLIFVTSGYRPIQPIYAIRPGAHGEITLKDKEQTNASIAWSKSKDGPYMPTPIIYGDYLYTCSTYGIVICYEAKTGKQVYRERLGGRGGYTASPVAADGRLYFISEEGSVDVIKAGPKFERLTRNTMDEVCMATPAISDGLLIVRTQHYVYGLGRQARSKERR